ncbi:hypothetical protein 0105phi72_081 [Bacillus phage 0105phi7-2]|uniref:Uncharacterized protein n=1 Tax=Bacillus phage 0105phi7-2 TaxID=3025408 RepID=A0AAE9YAR2_9CAUD|nr:hypothetical protein P9653_gp79 [Bacillus phage 0105phi7-2]WCS66625.1 hypothetical protein 0105phi72_081 [Bacillus phage 0105phi7-2]
MSEQKNTLSLKVDVDIKEANESIKELTAVANECVEAFEKLEKVMSRFEKNPVQEITCTPVVQVLLDGRIIAQNIEKGTQV